MAGCYCIGWYIAFLAARKWVDRKIDHTPFIDTLAYVFLAAIFFCVPVMPIEIWFLSPRPVGGLIDLVIETSLTRIIAFSFFSYSINVVVATLYVMWKSGRIRRDPEFGDSLWERPVSR